MKRPVRVSGSFAFHAAKPQKKTKPIVLTTPGRSGLAVAAAIRITVQTKDPLIAKNEAQAIANEMLVYMRKKYPDTSFSHLKIAGPISVITRNRLKQ